MQAATPVLLLTRDDCLWQHWRTLDAPHWPLARGRELADLRRWREQRRSVVVIDTDLPGLPALSATANERWQPLLAGMQAIVASARPSDAEGIQAILGGARGYCHAYAPTATLANVLAAVTAGSVWMGAALVNRLLRQVHTLAPAADGWHHDALTEREHTIARHVAQGESNSAIATALGISERTVKAHLTAIFDKLQIEDRLQLALIVHGVKAYA